MVHEWMRFVVAMMRSRRLAYACHHAARLRCAERLDCDTAGFGVRYVKLQAAFCIY